MTSRLSIATWNVWRGEQYNALMPRIAELGATTDVICLQEVYANQKGALPHSLGARTNLYEEVQRMLAETHIGFYFPVLSGLGNGTGAWGQAIFVRHGLQFSEYCSRLVHGHPRNHTPHEGTTIPRHLNYVVLEPEGAQVAVAAFHGHWMGKGFGKGDSPERIEQARNVRDILRQIPGKLVFLGDFNLLPDTKSLGIMTEGLHDLVAKHDIADTRSAIHYDKSPRYADYVFLEPGIAYESFQVLPWHEASDHLPLRLIVTL